MNTIKGFFLAIALFLSSALFLSTCFNASSPAANSPFLGTWESRQENSQGSVDRVISYFPFGLYEERSIVHVGGQDFPYWVDGHWSVDNDKLAHVVTASKSLPFSPEVGSRVNVTFVFLDKDTVELHYPSGKVFKAFRKLEKGK